MRLNYTTFMMNDVMPDALFLYSPFDTQKFLTEKGCFLSTYKIGDLLYADWLDAQSKLKNVNPKITLVNLQKEQSIIAMKQEPPVRIMNRAFGYAMTDAGDNDKYYGFEIQNLGQLNDLAHDYAKYKLLRQQPTRVVDGGLLKIHPLNIFTSVLYEYTPWTGSPDSMYYAQWGIHGTYLFWQLWKNYWTEELMGHSHLTYPHTVPPKTLDAWLEDKP